MQSLLEIACKYGGEVYGDLVVHVLIPHKLEEPCELPYELPYEESYEKHAPIRSTLWFKEQAQADNFREYLEENNILSTLLQEIGIVVSSEFPEESSYLNIECLSYNYHTKLFRSHKGFTALALKDSIRWKTARIYGDSEPLEDKIATLKGQGWKILS